MKYILITLSLFLFSCGQKTQQIDRAEKAELFSDKELQAIEDKDKQQIWQLVAVPIMDGQKEKVIGLFDFPLNSEFDILSEVIKKPIASITKEDFMRNYDKIFNQDFIKSLKTKSYKDIKSYSINDKSCFTLTVHRQVGQTEAGIYFDLCKSNDSYSLNGFYGVGADFYDEEE